MVSSVAKGAMQTTAPDVSLDWTTTRANAGLRGIRPGGRVMPSE